MRVRRVNDGPSAMMNTPGGTSEGCGKLGREGSSLLGTKVVKDTRDITAQKSSHQNACLRRRRVIRTMVIGPDTRKKAKVESVAHEGQNWQNPLGKGGLAFEVGQGQRHSEESWDGRVG